MDDTERRPMEARVMADLDKIIVEAEAAMRLIQDDSRMSGPADKAAILKAVFTIESRIKSLREALRISGTYSSERLDGDADVER
jgi:hypothetical protein